MLLIDAWLSLVERCVRDAEVASSNLVASMKKKRVFTHVNTLFFFIHAITSVHATFSGANARVRAQRVHEVRGASALNRPERSGDRKFKSCGFRGVRLEYIVSFVLSVAASIAAYYICK